MTPLMKKMKKRKIKGNNICHLLQCFANLSLTFCATPTHEQKDVVNLFWPPIGLERCKGSDMLFFFFKAFTCNIMFVIIAKHVFPIVIFNLLY